MEKKVLINDKSQLQLQRSVEFADLSNYKTLDQPSEDDNMIRIYGDGVGASIQLRGYGPITHIEQPRRMIATAFHINANELDLIITRLKMIRNSYLPVEERSKDG